MSLSHKFLLRKYFAEFTPGFGHEGESLRATLHHPRLATTGATRVDHQVLQCLRLGRTDQLEMIALAFALAGC